jgi:hypothetical protein
MDNHTKRTPYKKRGASWHTDFITALRNSGNVRAACNAAHIDRRLAYDHREKQADFAAQWDSAIQDAADVLEAEAQRRAFNGVPEPVYYQGQQVGAVTRYSDTLLIFLLKGIRPEKYGDRIKVDMQIRAEAERLAQKLGLSVDDVIAQAEDIIREARATP